MGKVRKPPPLPPEGKAPRCAGCGNAFAVAFVRWQEAVSVVCLTHLFSTVWRCGHCGLLMGRVERWIAVTSIQPGYTTVGNGRPA